MDPAFEAEMRRIIREEMDENAVLNSNCAMTPASRASYRRAISDRRVELNEIWGN